MATAPERYTDAIEAQLQYLGSWPTTSAIAVADIGVIEGRSFVAQATLADLGVEVAVQTDERRRDVGYATGAEVSAGALVGAEAPLHPGTSAAARVNVEFTARNAILMRAEGCRNERVERLDLLKGELLRLHREGRWPIEWIAVSEVVHAERLITLIAEAKGASVELGVSAGIDASSISLAEGQGRISVLRRSEGVLFETSEQATPLYRALCLRKRSLRKPRVKQADRHGRARGLEEDFDVVEFDFSS
jgi:hypothetical protein